MSMFVGAEFLIASMLIEKKRNGINFVSLNELAMCGIYVQKMSVQEKLDAIFLISKPQVYNAIYDFSDYFECKFDEENNLIGIKIQASRNIDDLEYRFMGYLPNTIFEFLMNAVKNYAA